MNFSAKKLITCSAKQLCYFFNHPNKYSNTCLTERVLDGQRFQEEIHQRLGKHSFQTEMGGCLRTKHGDNIYFSHDIVKNDGTEIWETKRLGLNERLDRDYFEKSLLQCAIYDVLTRCSSPILRKSKFCRDEWNDCEITLKKGYIYHLHLGRSIFEVKVTNPYPIYNFIIEKTIASRDYQTAEQFDALWKDNEYTALKNCFTVKRIL